ncbi:endospore germination permease [Paenibacillus sp. N1-5-1-14]|uniref:GerAB/ArcD/ProY family transporter n=1 Tax=Paenibacillus radicibacter TaxID=2972488 RepID=UPI0021590BC9|nr:endospore germination permease [Paenibacillus radicibacter]MCR8643530.1 endospore germination permease [Paenibacillus radicibacter]
MIEKGKITPQQLSLLMYPYIIATGMLISPFVVSRQADRDLWFSPLFGFITGFLAIFLAYKLSRLFPNQTFIEYIPRVIGKVAGKIVAIIYIIFLLQAIATILRENAQFLTGNFFQYTPVPVIMGSILLTAAYNVRSGLEVMCRTAQFTVPIVLCLVLATCFLNLPTIKPANILPVFEFGVLPSYKGSFMIQGWLSEFFIISFLIPYLNKPKKVVRWTAISALVVVATLILINMTCFMILGTSTKAYMYTMMLLAENISFPGLLNHLEALVMAFWVLATFTKLSVFFYASVLGTAQVFKLSDYKHIVFPYTILLLALGQWSLPSTQELFSSIEGYEPFYLFTFNLVIPSIILLIAIFQKKLKKGIRSRFT